MGATKSQMTMARFITLLVNDPVTQKSFNENPDAEMHFAGLSSSQRKMIDEALEGEGFRKLLAYLAVPGERPGPDEPIEG